MINCPVNKRRAWARAARPALHVALLTILCQSAAFSAPAGADDVEARIHRIEAGLLPPVLIRGEETKVTPLAARMATLRVPGVSIAVIHDGKIEWARGFGAATIGGPAVSAQTLFQAASISKTVSAVGVMRLVQDGKLELDANINEYLKTWKLPDNDFTKQSPVTLRRLLTHSAGVTVHGFAGYEAGAPVPDLVHVLNGEAPANSPPIRVDIPPGQTWRYSGGGYVIALQAVMDVTGKPFPKLMQDLVLRPFGMKDSSFDQPLPPQVLSRAATPYRGDGTPVRGGPHVYPELTAAGLWTTPSDLARFAIGIQQALAGKSNRVLSEKEAHAMLEQVIRNQAIGFQVGGSARKFFRHDGANDGYQCLLVAYQDGDGVAIMTNSDSGEPLQSEILRTIAHEYHWPDYASPERVLSRVDPKSFDRYEGAYRFANGTVFSFWHEGEVVHSRIVGQQIVDLFPSNEQDYFAKVVDARVTFSGEGNDATAVLHQNALDQTLTRLNTPEGQAELDWSRTTDRRVREQTANPRGEAAVRGLIAGLVSKNPAYDTMVPAFAGATRQQLPALNGALAPLGAVQSVSFERVLLPGIDVYEVKFEKGTRVFGVLLNAEDRIHVAGFCEPGRCFQAP